MSLYPKEILYKLLLLHFNCFADVGVGMWEIKRKRGSEKEKGKAQTAESSIIHPKKLNAYRL
jgi:hypothetical protein